jgi:hypothetical protein
METDLVRGVFGDWESAGKEIEESTMFNEC